jgi:hypothetical protein
MTTIDELLKSLQNPNKTNGKLQNTRETWERIGNKDSFSELGLEPSELDSFLKDFVKDNPYSNIA